MDVSGIVGLVSKAAPLLGTVLTGPAGAAVGLIGGLASMFGSDPEPEALEKAIKADPDAVIKLRQFEAENRTQLLKVNLEHAAKVLAEVGQTMRTEAKSDKWWVSGWRPFWGFISAIAFAILVGFVCFLAYEAIIGGKPEAMAMIPQMIGAFAALFGIPGAILGVASWHRGKEKRIKAGEAPAPGLLQRLTGK